MECFDGAVRIQAASQIVNVMLRGKYQRGGRAHWVTGNKNLTDFSYPGIYCKRNLEGPITLSLWYIGIYWMGIDFIICESTLFQVPSQCHLKREHMNGERNFPRAKIESFRNQIQNRNRIMKIEWWSRGLCEKILTTIYQRKQWCEATTTIWRPFFLQKRANTKETYMLRAIGDMA